MTTPSAVPRNVPQISSMKRRFPGAGSSLHEFEEQEMLEVPPPVSHGTPYSSKEKEVMEMWEVPPPVRHRKPFFSWEKRAKGKEPFAVPNANPMRGAYDISMPDNVYDFSSSYDLVWGLNNGNMSAVEPNMLKPSQWSSGFRSNENQKTSSSMASVYNVDPEIKNKRLQNYVAFKNFDMVKDFSDHRFSGNDYIVRPQMDWVKGIQEEWKILKKGVPDTIFVRAYESRMELLRAVIVGAEGTPYHDGLFFFDIYFPIEYPNFPPIVHYHSGGLKINPNLNKNGTVCLSLLGTWISRQLHEEWVPGNSTVLQVLVSMQGLILNAKPYRNEAGYEERFDPEHPNVFEYNEEVFTLSLKTMLYNITRPPKHFEDFVVGHFCKYGRDILVCCRAYMDGAQVGCLVKGGVQDVDEGDRSCSQNFKNHLAALIPSIIDAFSRIGVEDCEKFLSLAEKATGEPQPFPPIFYG